MLISPKHKFAFILNPKTGCTSVYNALKKIEDDEKICGAKVPNDPKDLLHTKHTPCWEFLKHHPEFADYYKFAFVRNPWDRVVSWYFFSKRHKYVERDTSNVSFDDFVTEAYWKDNIWANSLLFQYRFTKGCDFIGRTENLQSDVDVVCDKIGIPRVKLGNANKTEHKHYSKYYNWNTREIVADVFADEIDYFDYWFKKSV